MSRKSRFKIGSNFILFTLCVVIPTGLACIYYGLVATDIFVSESRFVVRSPDRQAASPIGLILQGAGFSRAQDDSYTVHDYVMSRDALTELNKSLNLNKSFSKPTIDVFNRFAGIDGDNSFEALYKYYQKRIDVQHDSGSSISTIVVRAFTPTEAVEINRRLLELSEDLVNRLNERGRADLIRIASGEVTEAENKAKAAGIALSSYREATGLVDPERQAALQLSQITKFQDELLATRLQISQLQTYTPDNPQLSSLRNRAAMLEKEISKEAARTTVGDQSMAKRATQFQRLVIDRDFAEKQLAATQASLENAKNEARRKQVYLERIAHPSLPDKALEPKRIRSAAAVLLLGLIAWAVLSMVVAGVREHRD